MNNPTLKIAVCNHRTDKRYKNVERPWQAIKDRNRVPVRTTETAAEYPRLSKDRRDALKSEITELKAAAADYRQKFEALLQAQQEALEKATDLF